jgi:hypothetical protein
MHRIVRMVRGPGIEPSAGLPAPAAPEKLAPTGLSDRSSA